MFHNKIKNIILFFKPIFLNLLQHKIVLNLILQLQNIIFFLIIYIFGMVYRILEFKMKLVNLFASSENRMRNYYLDLK